MTTPLRPGDRVAITGVTGFVGQSLAEHMSANGYRVIGISDRKEPQHSIRGLIEDYHCADLTAKMPSIGLFNGMVHLAGLASVGPSFSEPQRYLDVHSSMVTNILEDAIAKGNRARFIMVSTGALYGAEAGVPGSGFDEESSLAMTSPYVLSKFILEKQAEYYRRRGLDTLVARPFNHIGRRQRAGFIVPDLALKVSDWNGGDELPVGNLESARDYTDVRDVVRAYRLLLEADKLGHSTFNVCSGETHAGWELLELICSGLGLPVPQTRVDAGRALDPSIICGNAGRLRAATGWAPTYSLQESISDFLDFYER